jgi:hypothetical protein
VHGHLGHLSMEDCEALSWAVGAFCATVGAPPRSASTSVDVMTIGARPLPRPPAPSFVNVESRESAPPLGALDALDGLPSGAVRRIASSTEEIAELGDMPAKRASKACKRWSVSVGGRT